MKQPLFLLAASLVALPALAAGPVGFNAPAANNVATTPNGVTTVAQVLENAPDDAIVTLRGRFTEHVRGDDYVFVDEKGTKIRAELDDDKDWSMVKKTPSLRLRLKLTVTGRIASTLKCCLLDRFNCFVE